jgi:hypothetical protein
VDHTYSWYCLCISWISKKVGEMCVRCYIRTCCDGLETKVKRTSRLGNKKEKKESIRERMGLSPSIL